MNKKKTKNNFLKNKHTIQNIYQNPLFTFNALLFLVLFFTLFSVIMVFSASYVTSLNETGSLYKKVISQVLYSLIGIIIAAILLFIPLKIIKKYSFITILLAIFGLILVLIPGIGAEINDSRRWISVSSLTIQPSEFAKVALCLWGANLLAHRIIYIRKLQQNDLLFPLVPITLVISFLIIREPNYSTTMIIILILLTLLWFSGVSFRLIFVFFSFISLMGIFFAFSANYRLKRIMSFFSTSEDVLGDEYQITQSKFAFANGGIFGKGLGNGEAKYLYLPNADNDFIFAIIGEEFGLIGCLIILSSFIFLSFIGITIVKRSVDPFIKILVSTITTLIVLQAFLNIGYTIGILPVTGVQLPFLSAGGSATIANFIFAALLLICARHEPEAIAFLEKKDMKIFGIKLPNPKPFIPNFSNQKN